MLVDQKAATKHHISLPSPSNSPTPSLVFSDSEMDDEPMSSEEQLPPPSTASRPVSVVFAGLHPFSPVATSPRAPSLQEILANTAPPPWTLAAFTSHLSQNHCLENLEFVKDAEKYKREYTIFKEKHSDVATAEHIPKRDEVKRLWTKIMRTYVAQNSQREVNIPGDVRDRLLEQPSEPNPPGPEALETAVKRVYELMNDSVMLTFISELSPTRPVFSLSEQLEDSDDRLRSRLSPSLMRHRSRSRRKTSPLEVTSNFADRTRMQQISAPRALDSAEAEDSGSLLTPSDSPMTPPTTPPSSEGGGGSPRSRNDTSWRKMLGKLGPKKKTSGSDSSASSPR